MARRKGSKARLPRLTVLALSAQELVRFSKAMEQAAGLGHLMLGLYARFDSAVARLEQAAAILHRRRSRGSPPAAPPADDKG